MPPFVMPNGAPTPPSASLRPLHEAVTSTQEPRYPWTAAAKPLAAGWYPVFKLAAEFVGSALLLAAVAPVILLSAVLVKLTSRGPAFYSQVRLGRNGKPFRIHKIRTMTHNCENHSGVRWATANDPRITPIGKLLRATHLDELPQLLNVLKGEMSLVGPRPERPEFVPNLEQAIPHYCARLEVRPGVTGLAQVQLPADTDLHSVRRKLAYDLYYIRHMGPWLDLKLVLCTVVHMFGVPFFVLGRLFRLPGQEHIETAYQKHVETHTRLAPVAVS